jgi:putative phosphoesterase
MGKFAGIGPPRRLCLTAQLSLTWELHVAICAGGCRKLVRSDSNPNRQIKVGVVSDTHGYFDPRLAQALAGVSVILHAGDVGSQSVLDELSLIAPVHAVRGNVDGAGLSLPPSVELELAGCRVEMMHILPFSPSELEALRQADSKGGGVLLRSRKLRGAFNPQTDVVIFGHTHSPCQVRLGRCLFFNPGSAGRKRFSLPRCCGLMEIGGGGVRARLIALEANSEPLSGKTLTGVEAVE